MSIAYAALSVTEREAVDEAVDAASAKFNDWGIDVSYQKLKDAIEEALAGVVLESVRTRNQVKATACALHPAAEPESAVSETADLSYRDEGLFTSFLPNTPAGENAWREIAAKNDGSGKVLSVHAADTIRQLREAGYAVAKAGDVATGDDDALLAELGLPDGEDAAMAAQPKSQLKLIRADNNNCCVYYRGPEDFLYAFVQETSTTFTLCRCTQAGEASYPVDADKFVIDFVPAGDCRTANAFRAWHAARA